MNSIPRPVFIENNPDAIVSDIVSQYEYIYDKKLYPAQPERLEADIIAYRESLLRHAIQLVGEQCLVAFANPPALDQLAANDNVYRIPAQPARCSVHFDLEAVQATNIIIPSGTVFITPDARFSFLTQSEILIKAGEMSGDGTAICSEAGSAANNYPASSLKLQQSIQGIVATNTTITNAGAEIEDDEHFRLRIPESREGYTQAGSEGAYIYYTKAAHQDIIDATVYSPEPGTINVYPLTKSGVASQEIIDIVYAFLSAKNRRPMDDNVVVLPHTIRSFALSGIITLFESSNYDSTKNLIALAVSEYKNKMSLSAGKDVVRDQIKNVIMNVPGVYSVNLTSPETDIVLNEWELAEVSSVSFSYAEAVHG